MIATEDQIQKNAFSAFEDVELQQRMECRHQSIPIIKMQR